jgi:hypothetical protein
MPTPAGNNGWYRYWNDGNRQNINLHHCTLYGDYVILAAETIRVWDTLDADGFDGEGFYRSPLCEWNHPDLFSTRIFATDDAVIVRDCIYDFSPQRI